MDKNIGTQLRGLFDRFRGGQIDYDVLQSSLMKQARQLEGDADWRMQGALESTAARIDMIVLGVCEEERDAHIIELLGELEAKL